MQMLAVVGRSVAAASARRLLVELTVKAASDSATCQGPCEHPRGTSVSAAGCPFWKSLRLVGSLATAAWARDDAVYPSCRGRVGVHAVGLRRAAARLLRAG